MLRWWVLVAVAVGAGVRASDDADAQAGKAAPAAAHVLTADDYERKVMGMPDFWLVGYKDSSKSKGGVPPVLEANGLDPFAAKVRSCRH